MLHQIHSSILHLHIGHWCLWHHRGKDYLLQQLPPMKKKLIQSLKEESVVLNDER